MTLDDLNKGDSATIHTVNWSEIDENEARRLSAMGVEDGASVTMLHRGIFFGRDPLAIRIGRMTIALRRSHAKAMLVDTAPTAQNI